jgi:hypothetical protein
MTALVPAPAKQSADSALIAMIVTAAQDKSIEIDRLKELMEMRKDILAQESEQAFNRAMNAAQAEINPVVKDGENPSAHSRYATLEKVDREIRPIYTKHGFSLTFNTGTPANPSAVHVICEVRHSEGYKKEYFLEGDLDVAGSQGKSNKTSIQGLGSSVSYLRRYLTLMIFNVTLTSEDNDGNAVNRPAYDAMRHAADARQAARMAAQQTMPPQESPTELEQQLRDSIEMVERQKKTKNGAKSARKIDMLQAFGELKKRYRAIGMENTYYAALGHHGAEHSSDFEDTEYGLRKARVCFKMMQLNCADLEAYAAKQKEAKGADETTTA